MNIPFHKYQGTGNDFIMIDQRKIEYLNHDDQSTIKKLCDRRFGIGADGLIILCNADDVDFRMVYFNADGGQGSMCGNGGRCIIAFAHSLGIFDTNADFLAVDGLHQGKVCPDQRVSLQMQNVTHISVLDNNTFELNTGSPHYISFCQELPTDVYHEGAKIRNSAPYVKKGINVNFVQPISNGLNVATFERGVEDETFSCGTGVTAAAISYCIKESLYGKQTIEIETKGGLLQIDLLRENDQLFTNIWLTGPAEKVFEGIVDLKP